LLDLCIIGAITEEITALASIIIGAVDGDLKPGRIDRREVIKEVVAIFTKSWD